MLQLFTVFHLNLAYSSLEEAQHPQVIRDCYWPLLRLAERYHVPLGIEAPADVSIAREEIHQRESAVEACAREMAWI